MATIGVKLKLTMQERGEHYNMNIAILSDRINTARIQMEIRSMYSGLICNESDICFVDAHDVQIQKDLVIVDYNYLDEYQDNEVRSSSKFLLFIHGFIFDPYDRTGIEELEKKLIENEQWCILRTINKAKIHLNILHKKPVLDTKPTFLQLEITNYCNAKCIMCPHIYQGNAGAKHLTKDTFLRIEEILPYVEVAVLHGNGEPFMNPDIGEFLEIYRKYGIAISACTNLSVFNKNIASIVDKCFEDIRVSCDACSKDIYEKIRTGLSFDILVRNLGILKDYCSNVKKILTFVIMRQNISQIAAMVDFAAKYGFQEIIFSNMLPSIALGNENDSPVHFKEAVKFQLDIAEVKAKIMGIRITYPSTYKEITGKNISIDESFRTMEEWETQIVQVHKAFKGKQRPIYNLDQCVWSHDILDCEGICDWLVEKTYIDIDGNVFLCCINSTYLVGNIHDEPFLSVWNGKGMQELRSYFFNGNLPDLCHGCQFILNDSLKYIKCKTSDETFMQRRTLHNND